MTAFRFLVPGDDTSNPSVTDLVWAGSDRSSFYADIAPDGRGFPIADECALDVVRVGMAVYLVDRLAPRGADWGRDVQVEIPVSDPVVWTGSSAGLGGLLDFMTGDRWDLTFRAEPIAQFRGRRGKETFERVSLFSGGLDSFAGAVRARAEVNRLLLVGQHDSRAVAGVQNRCLRSLMDFDGGHVWSAFRQVARRQRQIGTAALFPTESTSRTRSFLFVALGIAAAYSTGSDVLWVPENGFVSINPPMAAERRAALSTRTTHPGLIDELTSMAAEVRVPVRIENPWEGMTKGDVLSWLRDHSGKSVDELSAILARTHSCARSNSQFQGFSPLDHCGVCFACLVRRGAFVAAGINDGTAYIEALLEGDRRKDWLTTERRLDYVTVRSAIARGGFSIEDVLALNLPRRYRPSEGLALANRGLDELAAVAVR
jgi:hypothetical protein